MKININAATVIFYEAYANIWLIKISEMEHRLETLKNQFYEQFESISQISNMKKIKRFLKDRKAQAGAILAIFVGIHIVIGLCWYTKWMWDLIF